MIPRTMLLAALAVLIVAHVQGAKEEMRNSEKTDLS